MRRGAALVGCALLLGCGGKPSRKGPPLPAEEPRVVTAGAELVAMLPAGADAVIELDLRRLRRNEVVGPVVYEASPAAAQLGALGYDPIRDADVIVVAVYRAGAADAATVVLVRGEKLAAPARGARTQAELPGTALDEHTLAYGPPAELGALLAGDAGLADDGAFRRLRDEAMPPRAPGASLRATARLTDAQRIAVAGRLGVDAVPATLSAWGDVADDAALLAILDARDPELAVRLARDVTALAARLAALAPGLRLGELLEKLEARAEGERVRVKWVVGPKALRAWVDAVAGSG